MLSFSDLGASSLEASGLDDNNLNTLSTQTPAQGPKIASIYKRRVTNQNDGIAWPAVFLFIAHEKGFYISCATPNWRIFLIPVHVWD